MHHFFYLLCSGLLLVACNTGIPTQNEDSGSVKGVVIKSLSTRHDGVTIKIKDFTHITSTTDTMGNYILSQVPVGAQSIYTEVSSYLPETLSVTVEKDREVQADTLQLKYLPSF